jgi:hypothetical protein
MDIIIRMQDGDIVKANTIEALAGRIIINTAKTGKEPKIADYTSPKRAQEVLDEIWDVLKRFTCSNDTFIAYEMPKE